MRLEGKTAVIIGGGQAPSLSAAIGNDAQRRCSSRGKGRRCAASTVTWNRTANSRPNHLQRRHGYGTGGRYH